MSESEEQRTDSPLLSERGVTKISDSVVTQVAGMAAQEVEGVHMGGGGSRAAGGVLGSITGSETKSSGISVEVGTTEAAIDLKMGIEYNKNILQTVEEVRRRITDRVQEMTGLRIKELNATITDITFPEKEQRRRIGSGSATSARDDSPETAADAVPETQTTPESELDAGESETAQVQTTEAETTEAEPTETEPTETEPTEVETTEAETTQVETPSRPDTGGSDEPEEEARAEDPPPEETAEVRSEDEASTTTDEPEQTRAETSEEEDAEARMRRRAEERARRRRRRSTGDS